MQEFLLEHLAVIMFTAFFALNLLYAARIFKAYFHSLAYTLKYLLLSLPACLLPLLMPVVWFVACANQLRRKHG